MALVWLLRVGLDGARILRKRVIGSEMGSWRMRLETSKGFHDFGGLVGAIFGLQEICVLVIIAQAEKILLKHSASSVYRAHPSRSLLDSFPFWVAFCTFPFGVPNAAEVYDVVSNLDGLHVVCIR